MLSHNSRYVGEELLTCSGELCEVLVCGLHEDCGAGDSSQELALPWDVCSYHQKVILQGVELLQK